MTLLQRKLHHSALSSSMLRPSSLHFICKAVSSPSTINNTMMFSRNTLLAAAAAFYGASSVSAFAPSTGESVSCGEECYHYLSIRIIAMSFASWEICGYYTCIHVAG